MTSLVFVNILFNHLTDSLPTAWVKFLVADPDCFSGNPDLCLQYNANHVCMSGTSSASSRAKIKLSVGVIVGVVLGVAMALVVFGAFFFWRYRRPPKTSIKLAQEDMVVMNLTNAPFPLTFEDIMVATDNLSDAYIIGRGGHGVVYKVVWESGTTIVVKKIVSMDIKSAVLRKNFWSEIETIGKARHQNLVRLLGYMMRGKVGLLLYDYVSNVDLHSALPSKKKGSDLHLTWKARLRIAEGVAHGLAYLHHDHKIPIVHRDIKSSNVLLDNDLEAHISDFGLAKVPGVQLGFEQWLSTQNVLGTYGYIAPEVGCGTLVTPQLDVYSYEVLLLELLMGKEPTNPSYGNSLHVVAWVRANVLQNKGKMSEFALNPLLLDPMNLAAKNEMLYVQQLALMYTRENPTE